MKKQWAWLAAGLALNCAAAETPKDPAGQIGQDLIQQEQRRKEKEVKKQAPVLERTPVIETEEEDNGPFFTLNGLRFTKSTQLTRDELQAIAQPWLGKQVSYLKLQAILAQINQLYRSKNIYTAAAVLPEQKSTDGIIVIQLVEGSIGEILVTDADTEEDAYYRQWLGREDYQDNINVEKLEQDVLFYNRLHDQQLQAALRAGKEFGLTDIAISPRNRLNRDSLNISLDNYGYESTGTNQLSALYQRYRMFQPGDKALFYGIASEGLKSLSTSYSTVVGTDGWRLGGSLQYTETELGQGDFSDLDVTGDTLRMGLEASYLVYSDTDLWASLIGGISHTQSENEVAGEELSRFQTDQYQLGAELNWLGSQWQFSGKLFYSAINSREKVAGQSQWLSLWSPRATFIYNFDAPFYALAVTELQIASTDNVPGAASFSLGGPSTVRGYKPGGASGARGWYQQIELHYNGLSFHDNRFDMFAFYDYGEVDNLNQDQELSSAGAGLRISGNEWLSLELTAASAMKEITFDQDDTRVFAKLICQCL